MGEVIRFPDDAAATHGGRYVDSSTEPAVVIILPVVRVERGAGDTSADPTSGSRAKRGRGRTAR